MLEWLTLDQWYAREERCVMTCACDAVGSRYNGGMSAAAAAVRAYEPAAYYRLAAIEAELLENTGKFRSSMVELIDTLSGLADKVIYDPAWDRDRLATEVAVAHDFLAFLCREAGAQMLASVAETTPDLSGPYELARMSASNLLRAHAAACLLAIGTDAAIRQISDDDLEAGARILAKHNPLYRQHLALTEEHRGLLQSLTA